MGGQSVIAHKMGAYIKDGTHSNHNIGVLITQGDNGHITDCRVSRALVNVDVQEGSSTTLSTELGSPNPGSHVSLRSGLHYSATLGRAVHTVMDWLQCKCDEREIRKFGNPKINSRPLGGKCHANNTPNMPGNRTIVILR